MNTVPQELNWVEKRAACTIAQVFNQLCDGITNDVAAYNSIRQLSEGSKFRADMHSSGRTIFVAQPNQIPRARVAIGIVEDRIAVHEEWNGKKWSVTIGLNDEGRCTLRIKFDDEKEAGLEQWQFRKKALESLFFDA
jgi:hypothetical protein